MSKSKTKSDDAQFHAQAIWGKECKCDILNWYANKISWLTVPMSNDFNRNLASALKNAVAVVSFGVSSSVVNGGIKKFEHDCVQIDFTCKNCKKSFSVTSELFNQVTGKQFRMFYYGKFLKLNEEKIYSHPIPCKNILKKFEKMDNQIFDSINYNSSNFAHQFYSSIENFDMEEHVDKKKNVFYLKIFII